MTKNNIHSSLCDTVKGACDGDEGLMSASPHQPYNECYLIQHLSFLTKSTLQSDIFISNEPHITTLPQCCFSAVAHMMFVLVSCQYNSVEMPSGTDDYFVFISRSLFFSLSGQTIVSRACLRGQSLPTFPLKQKAGQSKTVLSLYNRLTSNAVFKNTQC